MKKQRIAAFLIAQIGCMEYRRVYVEVTARFSKSGGMIPLEIVWSDGRKYKIDRVTLVSHASSRLDPLLPVRYKCLIGEREKLLYFEPQKEIWFVELSA